MANKSELIKRVAGKIELTKKDLEIALAGFTSEIEEIVSEGEKVSLVGFGTFEPKTRAARTVQKQPGKPELGTKNIPESVAPIFHAGKTFKDIVKGK